MQDFIKELYKRFALETPRFFQVLQSIGVVLMIITGIPEFLLQLKLNTDVDLWSMLPGYVQVFASKTFAVAGFVMKFMAKLPAKDANDIHPKKLPYTNKNNNDVQSYH